MTFADLACPNTPPCQHSGVFHDIEDWDDTSPPVLHRRLHLRDTTRDERPVTVVLVVAALTVGYLAGRARLIRRADDRLADILDKASSWPTWLKPVAFIAVLARFPVTTVQGTWRYWRTGTVWPKKARRG